MGAAVAVPEPFRCRRSDGKQWRCPRRARDGYSFCELHHQQARRRQSRKPVPDSLKLPRRRRGASAKVGLPLAAARPGERGRPKNARKKMGNGELAMELVRLVLRRMMQRREEKERKKMAAAAAAEKREKGEGDVHNVGEPMNQKVVLNSSSFLRWCFRSKNVERPPLVASFQMIPKGEGTVGCGKSRKKVCQLCQERYRRYLVRCSGCQKVLFCRTCVKKWYPDVAETQVKMACPICLGTCLDGQDVVVKGSM